MADGNAPPHRRRPAGRGVRRKCARHRSIPARAGRASGCGRAVAAAGRRVTRRAASLRRGRQRRAAHGAARAAAGVRDPGHRARALGPRRQPGLGHHDGLGPGRQLDHRAAAAAPGTADAGGAHQPAAAGLPGGDAAGHRRLRGAVPRPRAGRWCAADGLATAARDRPAFGRRGRGLQQLGRRRVAHQHRPAAAGQRPAPQAQRARAVVLRAPRGPRPESGWGNAAGPAGGGAGAERAHRLGLHQHRTRRPGPLPGADRCRRRRPLPHPRRLGAVRDRH